MWKIKQSLTARVLCIALFLLILPLFALVSFLYYRDIWLEKESSTALLESITNQSHGIIKEMIEDQTQLLDTLAILQFKYTTAQLAAVAKANQVSHILHVAIDSLGRYLCDASSDTQLIGRDYTSLVKEKQKGIPFGYAKDINAFFLLGKIIEGQGWVFLFSKENLHIDWASIDVDDNVYAISLMGENGEIIITIPSDLSAREEKVAACLEKSFAGNNLTRCVVDKQPLLVVKKGLSKSNVFLLVSAPLSSNPAAIPYFLWKVVIMILAILLLGGGGTLLLTFYLAKPLKQLCEVMQAVGSGELNLRFTPTPMGFEINVLGKIFNEVVNALIQRMKEVEEERVKKEKLVRELQIGQEVQSSIIPKELPTFPGIDLAARFISAQEVGGDFYDFLVKEEKESSKLMIAIADTSGKGIYACLYSLTIRSILRSYSVRPSLEEMLQKTNTLFCQDTADSGVFVTAWVAYLDRDTKEMVFSSCGHHPAFLHRKGEVISLTTKGVALGAIPVTEIETKRIQLQSGDRLLLFTDGIVEAHNAQQEMFGENRMIKVLRENPMATAKEMVDSLIEEVALFADTAAQHDDLTVIALRIL